jgi:hypothetical protein
MYQVEYFEIFEPSDVTIRWKALEGAISFVSKYVLEILANNTHQWFTLMSDSLHIKYH